MLHATLLASRILRWPLKKFMHTYTHTATTTMTTTTATATMIKTTATAAKKF